MIAGFASTIGWPLSAWLHTQFGWRGTCQVWALVHIALALPLNIFLPRAAPLQEGGPAKGQTEGLSGQSETFAMVVLAYVFAAVGFVSSGLSAILPTMLITLGATPATALFAGTLIGPAQVGARMVEAGWLARYHPLVSARLATLMHPIGIVTLIFGGPLFASAFAIIYGAGIGIITIARGTLPLALFGPAGFGKRVGIISLPSRATAALAPLAIGLMVEHIGTGALCVSALASLSGFVALLLLRPDRPKKAGGSHS